MAAYGVFSILGMLAFLCALVGLGIVLLRKDEKGRAPVAFLLLAILLATAHYFLNLDRRDAVTADIIATVPLFCLTAAAVWRLIRAPRR